MRRTMQLDDLVHLGHVERDAAVRLERARDPVRRREHGCDTAGGTWSTKEEEEEEELTELK